MNDKEKAVLWHATRAMIYANMVGNFGGALGHGLIEEFKRKADELTTQFFDGWRPE